LLLSMTFLYHKNLNFSTPWHGLDSPSNYASGGQKPF
jgi:hypothetical protein